MHNCTSLYRHSNVYQLHIDCTNRILLNYLHVAAFVSDAVAANI